MLLMNPTTSIMQHRRVGIFTMTGRFEGVRVYESRLMRSGAGLALPGIGIVVYPGANSTQKNIPLLRHEFGHILQARETGALTFYFKIGISSLWSAIRNGKRAHRHWNFWTERWANDLADAYFKNGTKKV
jgi:hypothetical protein